MKTEHNTHFIQHDKQTPTLNIKQFKKYSKEENNKSKVKVCCIFTSTGIEGKKQEYLGLLDT